MSLSLNAGRTNGFYLTFFSQEVKSKILDMKQLQPDSEFQKSLKECASSGNCE